MSTISYHLTSAKSSGSADADAYHNKIADNMLGSAVRDWYGCSENNSRSPTIVTTTATNLAACTPFGLWPSTAILGKAFQ